MVKLSLLTLLLFVIFPFSNLVDATLINIKILIILGIIGGVITAFISKDFWKNERLYISIFFSGVLGFGLINCIFLSSNLVLAGKNIKENIQTPILKVSMTYPIKKRISHSPNGKKASIQIKNYVKDVKFPLEAEIKEGQLLNFSVRKGFWGFDIIELKTS